MRKLVGIVIAIPEDRYGELRDEMHKIAGGNVTIYDEIRERLLPLIGEDFLLFPILKPI